MRSPRRLGAEPEIRAYKNMYGNVMATPPGGMPETASMPAYRVVDKSGVAEFVEGT